MRRSCRVAVGVLVLLMAGCQAALSPGPAPTPAAPAATAVIAPDEPAGPVARVSVWGEVPKECA